MDRRPQCIVLIDALGWRLAEAYGFLAGRLPYRRAVRSILGFSSGAIPTLLTGMTPAQHGRWNLLYRDPQHSPFRRLRGLRHLPDWSVNHRAGRKLMQWLGRQVFAAGPGFDCAVSPRLLAWFAWAEPRHLYALDGMPQAAFFFRRLQDAGRSWRVYSYAAGQDAALLTQLEKDLRERRAEIYFLYLCKLDHLLHEHLGKNEPVIAAALEFYAQRLDRLAGMGAKLTVISDHGMAPVQGTVNTALPRGWRMPDDLLAVADATMFRCWYSHREARREMEAAMREWPHGRLLAPAVLEAEGLGFCDSRYGESLWLADPGWMIAETGFHRHWQPAGMHGYHPDDADSDAVWLSETAPAASPDNLQQVYGGLCELAGLQAQAEAAASVQNSREAK